MRSHRRALALVAAVAVIATACGDDDDESTSTEAESEATTATTAASEATTATTAASEETTATTAASEETTATTEYVPPARGDADLVIWADDTRTPVIQEIADTFATDEGINVSVLEVPFDRIRDTLSTAGPAGQGPDIVIGAHDWLGELVANGAVAPLDLGANADLYSDVAIQAFTYDGQTYGLPYAVENIALIRNTDLVPEAPATFEDLEATALALQAEGTVDVPLAVQQNPGDPYHNYPMFTGAGGYVFGQNADGTYNPEDLGIDSPGGLAAAELFGKWADEGLINGDVSYDVMIDSFTSGRAPFAITGPWAVGDFTEAGVNFAVEPIPPVAGGETKPFVGVQGFMISAFTENEDLAKTFILDYLGTEEVQLALFEAGGRPPAMTSAFDQVATDPIIQGFGQQGQQGQPLPAIPEMSAVWSTWTDAYSLIFSGSDPTQAFTDAAATIRDSIANG
jgi:arabinogalactan oligomer/maltooligosaccharide transport system substrate-binding protein